jgi:hypothetical protein
MSGVWFGCVLLSFVFSAPPLNYLVAYAIDFASDAAVVSEVAPQEAAHAHAH